MRRKTRQSANNKTISLPEEMLNALSLQEGGDVDVFVDQQNRQIIIRPAADFSPTEMDAEFANQISDFIKEYRPALEELTR